MSFRSPHRPFLRSAFFLVFAMHTFALKAATVFVIESYHDGYPWVKNYRHGLESMLSAEHELHYFQMDTKRIPESAFERKAEEAWATFRKSAADFLVVADDNALRLLAGKLNQYAGKFV